jgi:hypothetical protein
MAEGFRQIQAKTRLLFIRVSEQKTGTKALKSTRTEAGENHKWKGISKDPLGIISFRR